MLKNLGRNNVLKKKFEWLTWPRVNKTQWTVENFIVFKRLAAHVWSESGATWSRLIIISQTSFLFHPKISMAT